MIALSLPVRYGIAVVVTAAGALLRVALAPIWGPTELPFITFFPAVMVSAWLGGFGPGLMTTLLSALVADWLWIAPRFTMTITRASDAAALLVYVVMGALISLLNELLRREASAVIRSEERWRTTLASIGDAVIATDTQGRVTQLNLVAQALTGWTEADAIGRPVDEVFVIQDEQSRRPAISPVERVLRDGLITGLANHTVLVARDGREIPIDDSAAPIRAPGGTVSGVVMVFRDITERRRGDDMLRLALEAAPTAMLIVDQNGTLVLVNGLAEQLLGYARAELVGMSVDRLVPARLRAGHADHRATFYGAPRQRPMGGGRELFALRKDGSEVAVEIGLSPIAGGDGMLVIAAVTDITDRRRIAEAERQARREAEQANRAKDEFLALLSHELRTPLDTILGWTGMLRTGALTGPRTQHALEVIEHNARAEGRLVASLLDVSRILAGKLELASERVDLGAVVAASVEEARLYAGNKDVSVTVTVPPDPVVIIGDELRVRQIISNLLSNSVEFTPRGGHVKVLLARDGSRAVIRVSDDGEGIAPELLPRVFDRFWQADSGRQRAHRGLGLGLTIVRDLVAAHGGDVVAQSPGRRKGSSFTVSLPIPAVVPLEVTTMEPPPPPAVTPSLAGLLVLVADDDPDARELLSLVLEARGALVKTAASAGEALELIDRGRPDVLIADIGMPHEDGYTLMQRLRARERERRWPRLPSIALTAYAGVADRERAASAGYDLHLAKPIEPATLAQAVARFRTRP